MNAERAVLVAAILLSSAGSAVAQEAKAETAARAVVVAPDALEWGPAPASLPAGAQLAVIEGNPNEAGEFTMRLRMPADYRIPPHYHRATEHVTVLKGTFYVGMGETYDASKGSGLAPGTFGAIPPQMRHFAWTAGEEVIIQLHGNGPWGIYYVDAADDPSRRR